jgi:hypothetical protein
LPVPFHPQKPATLPPSRAPLSLPGPRHGSRPFDRPPTNELLRHRLIQIATRFWLKSLQPTTENSSSRSDPPRHADPHPASSHPHISTSVRYAQPCVTRMTHTRLLPLHAERAATPGPALPPTFDHTAANHTPSAGTLPVHPHTATNAIIDASTTIRPPVTLSRHRAGTTRSQTTQHLAAFLCHPTHTSPDSQPLELNPPHLYH